MAQQHFSWNNFLITMSAFVLLWQVVEFALQNTFHMGIFSRLDPAYISGSEYFLLKLYSLGIIILFWITGSTLPNIHTFPFTLFQFIVTTSLPLPENVGPSDDHLYETEKWAI